MTFKRVEFRVFMDEDSVMLSGKSCNKCIGKRDVALSLETSSRE